ncbi:HNH endonuclease family protein [Streptomyces yaizuensis]|uniref:HNH endonuclease family protein n=1 Tax=Streptomyces yaizuensis TaxID=2989713 RepID=A0ABQ5P6K9_9ACTN|nr:HNH endonuclease family protein [Streptomyces sp. YSPA8]GLF98220.1 HNH endonuclease family protein [Streptomyces sp. YSPA8]
MKQRLLPGILVLAAALTGCSATSQSPDKLSGPGAHGTAAVHGAASAALESLPVKDRAPGSGYDRTERFGPAWSDTTTAPGSRNGCDARNDILARDLTQVTYQAGSACVIASGRLSDPYTGTRIDFVRGPRSAAVQIDHVVALSASWQTGAAELTQEQREALANDPLNLLASSGPANQHKSDSDAAGWLPARTAFRCPYVARQIAVKAKYGLWVTSAERDAMNRVLEHCPGQPLPGDRSAGVTLTPS